MAQVAFGGIAALFIDGNATPIVSGLTYRCGGVENETADGMDGIQGFTSKYVSGMMSFKIRLSKDLPLSTFLNLTSSTVVVQLVSGSTVSGYNMWLTKVPEADAAEGTAELVFESKLVTVG